MKFNWILICLVITILLEGYKGKPEIMGSGEAKQLNLNVEEPDADPNLTSDVEEKDPLPEKLVAKSRAFKSVISESSKSENLGESNVENSPLFPFPGADNKVPKSKKKPGVQGSQPSSSDVSSEEEIKNTDGGYTVPKDEHFELLGKGVACAKQNTITNQLECSIAARRLNLKWGHAWYGDGDFPGCLFSDDERQYVYFNRSPKPSTKDVNLAYRGICKNVNVGKFKGIEQQEKGESEEHYEYPDDEDLDYLKSDRGASRNGSVGIIFVMIYMLFLFT